MQQGNFFVKDYFTFKKTRFTLQILYLIAKDFLKYLRHIDKKSYEAETSLHKSLQNLVFFTTSLKSNEIVMEKLLKGKYIKLYEEDQDLLEDVIIENKQAIEMANIYSSILSGTMDTFASIISNNLNVVNHNNGHTHHDSQFLRYERNAFWPCAVISVAAGIFLYKKDMF